MSNIIQNAAGFPQIVKIVFPKKIHKLLEFGFRAVSIQRIISLNFNARSSVANRHTAESKIYRLTKNARFVKLFPKLLLKLKLISDNDVIAVDFSDFGGLQVLMFAKQTKSGRAIPLYFEIITYPITKGSQNTFIINTINEFLRIVSPLKVRFVFDRGFACPSIIRHLAEIKVKFYIRIKGVKSVIHGSKKKKAKQFKSGKSSVSAYGLKNLSLTITPPPQNGNEPWYIISNDTESTAEKIQKIYYYRFEIEELFKDAKRVFGLEYINFKKQHNFKTVLWFVILGIWLHYYLEETVEKAKTIIKKCKQSFNQSITHYWMERIKLAIQLPVLNQIFIKDG